MQWHNPGQQRYVITMADQQYPDCLKQLNRPLVVYAQGNLKALSLPSIAIAGSRKLSPAGKPNALDFGQHLAQNGIVITSGVALGVDAQAHPAVSKLVALPLAC